MTLCQSKKLICNRACAALVSMTSTQVRFCGLCLGLFVRCLLGLGIVLVLSAQLEIGVRICQ